MFVSSVNHLAFMFIAFFALFVNLSYYFDFDLKIFFDSYKIFRPSQLVLQGSGARADGGVIILYGHAIFFGVYIVHSICINDYIVLTCTSTWFQTSVWYGTPPYCDINSNQINNKNSIILSAFFPLKLLAIVQQHSAMGYYNV